MIKNGKILWKWLIRLINRRWLLFLVTSMCFFHFSSGEGEEGIGIQEIKLNPISSGAWRWIDVNDQPYSLSFRSTYQYTMANVQVKYYQHTQFLRFYLWATGLKPNFAYQIKIIGEPNHSSSELIGYKGRWWEQTWLGSEWSSGGNLNNKGDGLSPTPNDQLYEERKIIVDETSPTGLHYQYTGYRLLGYFITDRNGAAELVVDDTNSYHVLWKTTQRIPTELDGPPITVTYSIDPLKDPAYEQNFDKATVTIFGEWERLPKDKIRSLPGLYTNCRLALTEESFHGTSPLSGSWAQAMEGIIQFIVYTAEQWVPRIQTIPSGELQFGSVPIHTSHSQWVRIQNIGPQPLNFTEPKSTLLGITASAFLILSELPEVLPPFSVLDLEIQFQPLQVGSYEATLILYTNDPGEPQKTLRLQGFGEDQPKASSSRQKKSVFRGCQFGYGNFWDAMFLFCWLLIWVRRFFCETKLFHT